MNEVAVVSHTYPTRHAMAQVPFIKQEAHLIAQELKVEVHLPAVYALPFQKQYYRTNQPDETKLAIHQFSYLSFPGRRFASITQKSLSKNLLASIKKQDPDVVHLHWLYPAGLALPKIKKAGYPTVLTIHGGDWYSNISNQKLMPILVKSLHASGKIICVGKQLLKDIMQYDEKLASKLIHITHGIDTERFKPSNDKKNKKERLGWPSQKTNLLCVANLYYVKGIDLLIESFTQIREKENCHLHIVSATGEKKNKEKIKQLIKSHSIEDQVTFYGAQKNEHLADYFHAADLMISPSRKEGFGLVVAEAIACGTPVLATRSGGPEEILNDDCGILVEADSVEKLTAGLNSIIIDLNRFNEDKMHNHIKTNFSIVAKKEKLMSVYREITN